MDKMLSNKKKSNSKKLMEEELNEGVYVVEAIRKKKKFGNKWLYYIKWFGYPENQNTWEPIENLMCPDLLEQFEYEESLKKAKELNKKIEKKEKSEKEKLENEKVREIQLSDDDESSEEEKSKITRKNNNKRRTKMNKSKSNNSIKNFKEEAILVNKNKKEDENDEFSSEIKGNIQENIPKRILSAKFLEDKTLEFLVMWKKQNGFKPSDSYVSNEVLKQNQYYDLIIDFYEMRTRFQDDTVDSKKAVNSNDSTNNENK